MHKLLSAISVATILTAPAHAQQWRNQATDVRTGAFAGARIHLPLGGSGNAKARAALTIAPTRSRISDDGMVRTKIGEGLAFNLTARSKPTVTLAGTRADLALRLTTQDRADAEQKMGLSTGAWIGIGATVVAVAVGVGYLVYLGNRGCEPDEDCS